MLTAALFTVAKLWKEPKWPSTDKGSKRCGVCVCVCACVCMCVLHTIHSRESYSAVKKKETLPLATTGMDRGGISLTGKSHKEKDKYCMISLMESKKKSKQKKAALRVLFFFTAF